MQQCSTLFFTYELLGDEGKTSLEDPACYALENVLPPLPLEDVNDEVIQRILHYARTHIPLENKTLL